MSVEFEKREFVGPLSLTYIVVREPAVVPGIYECVYCHKNFEARRPARTCSASCRTMLSRRLKKLRTSTDENS